MGILKLVLVPVDGSPRSQQAIVRAIAIAVERRADIHFVHVIVGARAGRLCDEGEYAMHVAGEKLLDQAVDQACEHDLLATSAVLATDEKRRTVAQQILWAAGAMAADLIVCGSHGAGPFDTAQLGSVADELASTSKVSLLLVECEAAVETISLVQRAVVHSRRAPVLPGSYPADWADGMVPCVDSGINANQFNSW